MPAWLLRFLPYGLAIAAILGGVLWIDHQGYSRAKKDAAFERLVTANMILKTARSFEQSLTEALATNTRETAGRIDQLRGFDRTIIQPTLVKELSLETRYSDPAAGISDGLLRTLNAARRTSACTPTADGGIVCALSAPEPDRRPDAGGAGDDQR